jgi:hypothetical protein
MYQPLRPRRLLAVVVLSAALLAPAVADIPSAGAATPANLSYVGALYKDLLDRTDQTTDPQGVAYWANQLPARSRAQVAHGIQYGSDEYFRQLVRIAFLSYLDREPDASGAAHFIQAWRSRQVRYERVLSALLGSNEYYRLHGSTLVSFVNAAYFDVLGHEPDSAGRAHMLAVARDQGRGRVAALLAASHEALVAQVGFQYATFLGRIAHVSEINYWVSRLSNGLRREDFDVELLASPEYYANNS